MDSKQYTPEWGFEPGVVVEIDTTYGGKTCCYFHHSEETKLWINDYEGIDDPSFISFDDIKSIRLLSGKWSLWQFAPKDAVVMVIRHYTGNPADLRVQFLQQHSWDHLQHHVDNPGAVVYEAPWWWIHEFKGNEKEERT